MTDLTPTQAACKARDAASEAKNIAYRNFMASDEPDGDGGAPLEGVYKAACRTFEAASRAVADAIRADMKKDWGS
jgi:hypothetical protein